MSLILEALKKLEREKQVPAKGVVVVGAGHGAGASGEWRVGLFVLGLLLGGGLLGLARWRLETPAQPPQPEARTTASPRATPELPPTLAAAETDAAQAPTPAAASAQPAAPAAPVPSPAFTLQAISEREGRPVAIVNDRLVREGDSIDGARIARIAKDEVELEIAGKRVLLRF